MPPQFIGLDVVGAAPALNRGNAKADFRDGSQAEVTALIFDVCFTPNIRHPFDSSARQLRADTVEKVENPSGF
jgi:hypothetical protein